MSVRMIMNLDAELDELRAVRDRLRAFKWHREHCNGCTMAPHEDWSWLFAQSAGY